MTHFTTKLHLISSERSPSSRRRNRVFAFAVLMVLALPLGGGISSAATVRPYTIEQLTQYADAVVIGRVTKVTPYREKRFVVTDTVFHVEQVLKGKVDQEITIHQRGGQVGDFATVVPGLPYYQVAEHLLIFLEAKPTGTFVTAGLWQGKYTIHDNKNESFVEVDASFYASPSKVNSNFVNISQSKLTLNHANNKVKVLVPLEDVKKRIILVANRKP